MAAGSSGRTGVCVTSGMIGSGRRGPGGSWERGQAYGPFAPVPSTHAAAGPPRQTGGKAGTQTRHRRMARRRIHASRHPGQDRTRLSDAGFGGRCSPPEPECPLPGRRHAGRRRMAMTPPTGCVAQREHGETSDRRDCPDTGKGMASADAAWPHRSPPIGNHQPHILAALRPSGLQRRMCPWISFSPELGLAGQPTLGGPLFFCSFGRQVDGHGLAVDAGEIGEQRLDHGRHLRRNRRGLAARDQRGFIDTLAGNRLTRRRST